MLFAVRNYGININQQFQYEGTAGWFLEPPWKSSITDLTNSIES